MPVTVARRNFLAAEYREAKATDAAVQTAHPLAEQLVLTTALTVEADASTEAARVQGLRGVKRDRFQAPLELNDDTDALDLGDVIEITYARYGLDAGKLFVVLSVEPNARDRTVVLTVWG